MLPTLGAARTCSTGRGLFRKISSLPLNPTLPPTGAHLRITQPRERMETSWPHVERASEADGWCEDIHFADLRTALACCPFYPTPRVSNPNESSPGPRGWLLTGAGPSPRGKPLPPVEEDTYSVEQAANFQSASVNRSAKQRGMRRMDIEGGIARTLRTISPSYMS